MCTKELLRRCGYILTMVIKISIRCIQYSENSQIQLDKLHETEGRIYALENYATIVQVIACPLFGTKP